MPFIMVENVNLNESNLRTEGWHTRLVPMRVVVRSQANVQLLVRRIGVKYMKNGKRVDSGLFEETSRDVALAARGRTQFNVEAYAPREPGTYTMRVTVDARFDEGRRTGPLLGTDLNKPYDMEVTFR